MSTTQEIKIFSFEYDTYKFTISVRARPQLLDLLSQWIIAVLPNFDMFFHESRDECFDVLVLYDCGFVYVDLIPEFEDFSPVHTVAHLSEVLAHFNICFCAETVGDFIDLEPQSDTYGGILETIGSQRESCPGGFVDKCYEFLLGVTLEGEHGSLTGTLFKVPMCDQLVALLEDVVFLVYGFMRSRSSMDRLMSLMSFCKLRNMGLNSVALISLFAYELWGVSTNGEPEMQGAEEFFSEARGYLDSYDAFKNTAIVSKLKKFGLYVLSLGLFTKFGVTFDKCRYSRIEAAAITREHAFGPEFAYTLLDLLLFMCERGYQCMVTGSLDPIFHSGSTYQKWIDTVYKLKRDAKFICNPEGHDINLHTFLADLTDVIDKGDAIKRRAKDGDKRMVGMLLAEMQLVKANELSRRLSQKERKAPFSILLSGGSSIGKSSLTKILFYHYAKLFNLPCEPEFKYTRLGSEKHWNNFASYAWCIQMDDIAFMKPGCGEIDPTLLEILNVVNNVPFTPEQAALEDKGKTPVRAEFVIATTNTKHLNLHSVFACPFAVARRFPYVVDVAVKPQFATNGMLDPSKVRPVEVTTYADFWVFKVYKPVAPNNITSPHKLELVDEFGDIFSFLRFFSDKALHHDTVQKGVLKNDAAMVNIVLCDRCHLPSGHCLCPQTGEIVSESLTSLYVSLKDSLCSLRDSAAQNVDYVSDRLQLFRERSVAAFGQFMCPLCLEGYLHSCPYSGNLNLGRPDSEGSLRVFDPTEFKSQLLDESSPFFRAKTYLFAIILWFSSYVIVSMFLSYMYGSLWKYRLGFRLFGREVDTYRIVFRRLGIEVSKKINVPRAVALLACAAGASVVLIKFVNIIKNLVKGSGKEFEFGFQELHTGEKYGRGYELFQVYVCTFCGYASPRGRECMGCGGISPNSGRVPSDPQMGASIGKPPKPEVAVGETYYNNDPYVVSDLDVDQACGSDARAKFHKSVATFLVSTLPRDTPNVLTRVNNAFCIGGCVWMINNHGLYESDVMYIDVLTNEFTGVGRNLKNIKVTSSMIRRFPEFDVAFIELRNINPGKNFIKYFASDHFECKLDGSVLGRHRSGAPWSLEVKNLQRTYRKYEQLDRYLDLYVGVPSAETHKGDCGAILVTNGPIFTILGIHLFGNGKFYGALRLSREFVIAATQGFQSLCIEPGTIKIGLPGEEQKLLPIHKKSPLRYLTGGAANVYGSLPGFRAQHKSKVEPTFIAEALAREGIRTNFGKPRMDWLPWHQSLEALVRPTTLLDQDVLKEVTQNFIDDIKARLSDFSGIHVYDDHTTLNGAPGVRFVDKMKRNTSMGYPYKKSKRNFLTPFECDDPENTDVVFDRVVMDEVERIQNVYLEGKMVHPIFCGNSKDEPKEDGKKTRIFMGAPAAHAFVMRKYLLSVIKFVQENKFVFESGPGTVAQSLEWEQIREFLSQFPMHRTCNGDFQFFDKEVASVLMLHAFQIVEFLCVMGGYSDEEMKVVRGIAYDISFPLCDFNGDLIGFLGSNPSGQIMTVIINGLIHSLYMRYCYAVLSGTGSAKNFKKHVALMTYGDDGIFTVSEECNFFNHTSVQQCLKSVGITYTMADKKAASVPFIEFDDASFLKRMWRYDEDVGAYLAPLEMKSIEKMLTCGLRSRNISPQAHAIQVVGTALREYFFWGREVFNDKTDLLMRIVVESNLCDYVEKATFPSWEELRAQFWNLSKGVKLKRLGDVGHS
jgi:hypothetical protein